MSSVNEIEREMEQELERQLGVVISEFEGGPRSFDYSGKEIYIWHQKNKAGESKYYLELYEDDRIIPKLIQVFPNMPKNLKDILDVIMVMES